MILLDGSALAQRREPHIARRAAQLSVRRGRAPVLLLVAFEDADGSVPHVRGKLRACGRVGIAVEPLILPHTADASAAADRMDAMASAADGVFVQVPCPTGFDENALLERIPFAADIDVMTTRRTSEYLARASDIAPLTVAAALALIDEHGIDLSGRTGVVIAPASPFIDMLIEAFVRRGAVLEHVAASDDVSDARIAAADVVIAAAAQSGVVKAAALKAGCIALDLGYYNAGGVGDIDAGGDTAHLHALMAVPGGVGPMTVSMLLERVVEFAGG